MNTQISSLVESEKENLDSEKETILIVEDNQELRFFIKTIFIQFFNVIEAENGNIGLEKSKKYMPDIIIESKIEGMKLGADDYITKPFSAAYLKARIFNLLEQRKKLQVLYCASLLPLATEQQATEQTEKSSLPSLSPNDQKFMDKVMEAIEKHLDNGDLMVEDIASEVNMSRSVFFKKLKTLTGLSPVEFLREIRMKRAAQLIETEEYSMAQIAYITPTEYKESRKQTSL